MKSTKRTISRIYFFNKVLSDFPGLNKKNARAFPGVSRAEKIFQGFPGFPGPVRTLNTVGNGVICLCSKTLRNKLCVYMSVQAYVQYTCACVYVCV